MLCAAIIRRAALTGVILLHALLPLLAAAAPSLPTTSRTTSTNDVIGDYRLVPGFDALFDTAACARSVSASSFYFDQRSAPSTFPAPRRFNIFIGHAVTKANNNSCQSAGNIYAVQKSHPFVASSPESVVDSWSRGGAAAPALRSKLATTTLLTALNRSPWVFGYDFMQRVCRGTALRPGTAYMWFQPAWNIILSETPRRVILYGRNKYLLLTHRGRPNFACVYRAVAVGGSPGWPTGPSMDPSLSKSPGPAPAATAAAATAVATPARRPEPELPGTDPTVPAVTPIPDRRREGPVDGADLPPQRPAEPAQQQPQQSDQPAGKQPQATRRPTPEPIATDPDGIFGRNNTSGTQTSRTTALRACFPGSATVELSFGGRLAMRKLQPGHRVRASSGAYSDVYMFSHRVESRERHEFVRIATDSGHSILLSPGHYLYIGGVLVAASEARRDMTVHLGDGRQARIVSISRVWHTGMYAPHTLHGDVVVDGIIVSSYTTAVHPFVAHRILLVPLRWLYRAGVHVPRLLDGGAPTLSQFAPPGPKRLRSGW